jgi:hypothetical protein
MRNFEVVSLILLAVIAFALVLNLFKADIDVNSEGMTFVSTVRGIKLCVPNINVGKSTVGVSCSDYLPQFN